MFGRSISRFALAGLLAAAFAAPAVAQNPPPQAPTPRVKAGVIEIEVPLDDLRAKVLEARTGGFDFGPAAGIGLAVAPMPREVAQGPCCGADCCRKSVTAQPLVLTLPGETPELEALKQKLEELQRHLAKAAAPPREFVGVGSDGWQPVPITPPGGFQVPPGCCLLPAPVCIPLTTAAPNPLVGTWYRDIGVAVIAATFTHDELKLCLTQGDGANTFTVTVTAHYTLTKDGLVYGAVTGADVDMKLDPKAEAGTGMELAELSLMLQELTDRPFSFRTKMTSAGLMVSQLKAASGEQIRGQEVALLGGLFKSAKGGIVPAPKAPKAISRGGRNDCQLPVIDAPVQAHPYTQPLIGTPVQSVPCLPPAGPTMSEPIQRIGIDFTIAPPSAIAPPACNDAMKSMAADAFSQMMRPAGAMTLPSAQYLQHYPQYVAPDRDWAQPITSVAPLKPGHVGTWVRVIGSKQCVVKIEADHLTITVSEAHEIEGKTVTGHLTFTADYHTTRDGLTVVGLITSVDMKFDGDLPDDAEEGMLEKVNEMQKAMEEKPFAMTFRRYGETLVIGNVRMPEVSDRIDTSPGAYVGGRYTSVGDKPLPKLKAVKATEPKTPLVVYPLPQSVPGVIDAPVPPGYIPPTVQPGFYGSSVPPQPPQVVPPLALKGQLLPPQAVPCPAVTRPIEFIVPPGAGKQRVIVEESLVLPPAVAPTPPTMLMPTPKPPTMTMPAPVPLALDLSFPVPPLSATSKNDSDNKQIFNFVMGLFGNQ